MRGQPIFSYTASMDSTAEALLIVVSSALTVLLVVLIVALIYVISILRQLKRITERAENVVDSVESAAATFEKAASPMAVIKLIGSIVDQASKLKRKKG